MIHLILIQFKQDKDLIELAGKRFACVNELDNDALNRDLFKTLSGDEYYRCKVLYKNAIDIKLTAKLNIMSNSKPIF